MTDEAEVPTGTELEEMRIVVNSLHLCMGFLLKYIEKTDSKEAAVAARQALIDNLKGGNIDMAIFDDRKTFDFVTSIIESLPAPE